MEMGLGKTAVTLAEFMQLLIDDKVDNLIVVCPNSLKTNWANEVEFWSEGKLKSEVWDDCTPDLKPRVKILNYETLAIASKRGYLYIKQLLDMGRRVMLVLDESTQIKKHNGVRTKSLLGIARSCSFTRILSGAPMVQGPQDVWSQLKFIGALKGMPYANFKKRYCVMGGYQGKQIMGANPNTMPELQAIIDQNAFRAKKEDWTDIPPKMYYVRNIPQTPAQKRIYKEMVDDFVTMVNQEHIEAQMVITQMGKLQQISSGFVYDENKEAQLITGGNPKLNELKEILEEIDSRVVVVTFFTYSTKLLMKELEPYGVAGIYGGLSDAEIDDAKKRFNTGDARVIVCQSSAAKYGHTLLGDKEMPCHTTVFYENSFSLDDRLQIEDRNHRIGQQHGVNIIDFVTSTIEAKVIKALQQKKDLAGVIIDAVKTSRI